MRRARTTSKPIPLIDTCCSPLTLLCFLPLSPTIFPLSSNVVENSSVVAQFLHLIFELKCPPSAKTPIHIRLSALLHVTRGALALDGAHRSILLVLERWDVHPVRRDRNHRREHGKASLEE